ncbi:MAG TPA: sigma-70 family RNA polymerase sigma factor [Bacteroidota bacterium]|nr:sigma-70 family RNA polymerase sigma factor [Bacteroidota bacterium]
MPDQDQDIIRDIRAGNARAFSVLVERHKDRAMTLALRIIGIRAEAEELVQDAFLRAFRSLDQFRGDARFSTWFYRIVYNVCMTRLRRRPPVEEADDLSDDTLFEAQGDDEPSAHENLEREEVQSILHEEMDHLPEKFRIALTLFYVQELSYDEMTAVLEMPLGTVKTNLSRGRLLLRKRVLARMDTEVHAL